MDFARPQSRFESFMSFLHELQTLTNERDAPRLFGLIGVCFLSFLYSLYCVHATGSLALLAFTLLTAFYIGYLATGLLTLWIRKQHPTPVFSFGYERFEVMAVFSVTMLLQLGCFFEIKEGLEHMLDPEPIKPGYLIPGSLVGLGAQLLVIYASRSRAFEHVVLQSSSSWLQEHVADISRSICHVVPGLSYFFLPRINPFTLCGVMCCLSVWVSYFLVDVYGYDTADILLACFICLMIVGTMFPMSSYTGKILLQTTPTHMIAQLDKCLHEASTLDGVLEIRQQHFWIVSFGTLGGLIHVRIRRDANEQLVLAHVARRLSPVVQYLTIQLFKDDWFKSMSASHHFQAISGGTGNNSTNQEGFVMIPQESSESHHGHSHSNGSSHSHSHSHSHGHSH